MMWTRLVSLEVTRELKSVWCTQNGSSKTL